MTDKPAPATVPAVPTVDSSLVGELTGSIAPMPTRTTIYLRSFLPYQAYRFGLVNLKMLKIVRRSHTH